MKTEVILSALEAKHPGEKEYLQAVKEVLLSIEDVYNQHPEFEKAKIIERLVEPERIFTFRVPWVDDKGEIQVNLGYRVQFNNLRFRANIQECVDNTADGWWQGWFRFCAKRQKRRGNHAILPSLHSRVVA